MSLPSASSTSRSLKSITSCAINLRGSFSRSFYVGDKIKMEDIDASMKDGILSITVPKEEQTEPEKK